MLLEAQLLLRIEMEIHLIFVAPHLGKTPWYLLVKNIAI